MGQPYQPEYDTNLLNLNSYPANFVPCRVQFYHPYERLNVHKCGGRVPFESSQKRSSIWDFEHNVPKVQALVSLSLSLNGSSTSWSPPLVLAFSPPNWQVQYIHTYIHTYIYIYWEREREILHCILLLLGLSL